ncbi:MAG: 2-C-methyl-D-erythritol 4-phosphate cytidylyltransferase [Planctomycetales bacterium 4484_123]|nr:MAG: 2-C-methyl-D-erythritol 4-phosphate cytidylyltransferase [Planctomycetales bacterium 4484_123]
MKVSVIIPAAGASRRFGGKTKKIFERLGGRAVFIRSLELFVNRPDVCQVQLVVAAEDMETMQGRFGANLGFMGVKLVTGGAERTDSVRCALEHVAEEAEYICVHDAVRPCVSPLWIDAVFAAAARTGAAILAYPVHGTLKRADGERRIVETVDRRGLWEAQTPQVFRKELLLRAYAQHRGEATDDAALVEALGEPVAIVRGDPRNVKITTRSDLALAAAVVDSLPKPSRPAPAGPFDEARW